MTLVIADNTNTNRNVLEVQDFAASKFACIAGVAEPIVSSGNTIDGTGSSANPLTVPPSVDANNALVIGTDGRLYVPDVCAVIQANPILPLPATLLGTNGVGCPERLSVTNFAVTYGHESNDGRLSEDPLNFYYQPALNTLQVGTSLITAVTASNSTVVGRTHTVNGNSNIVGGLSNQITGVDGDNNFVSGNTNTLSSVAGLQASINNILSGVSNDINGAAGQRVVNSVVSGFNNTVDNFQDSVLVGQVLAATNINSSIISGTNSTISAASQNLIAGDSLTITSSTTSVMVGSNTIINFAADGFYGGFQTDSNNAPFSMIAGENSVTLNSQSVIVGGADNSITSSENSAIIAGNTTAITNSPDSSILGGSNGAITGPSDGRNVIVSSSFGTITVSTLASSDNIMLGHESFLTYAGVGQSAARNIIGGDSTFITDFAVSNVLLCSVASSIDGNSVNNASVSRSILMGGSGHWINTRIQDFVGGPLLGHASNASVIIGGVGNVTGGRSNHVGIYSACSSIVSFDTLLNAGSGHSGIFSGLSNALYNVGHSAILGGTTNTIRQTPGGNAAKGNSVILGGGHLKVREETLGHQYNPATEAAPFTDVDISAFTQLAFFGDVDMWLGNVSNTASALKFFTPNTDRTYATSLFSSFEAQAQATNIEYILPAALPAVGQQLTVLAVAGTVVTLGWV